MSLKIGQFKLHSEKQKVKGIKKKNSLKDLRGTIKHTNIYAKWQCQKRGEKEYFKK